MKSKHFIYILLFIGFQTSLIGQSLLGQLEKKYPETSNYKIATFKASRIGIGHSVETRKEGVLEFQSMTRFWKLPYNHPKKDQQSLVADKINTRFGLEYGISDRFTIGAGMGTIDGILDGFLKYKLLQQSSDKQGTPVTLTLLQHLSARTLTSTPKDVNLAGNTSDRLAYTSQLLIARKFSRQFSFQISPTLVHRGSSRFESDPENLLAIGFGGRINAGRHVSITTEYFYQANPLKSRKTYDALAFGVNWELSDVMLQFQLTNIRSATEDAFITQTPNNFNFNDGNFVFGFTGIFLLHTKNRLKKE